VTAVVLHFVDVGVELDSLLGLDTRSGLRRELRDLLSLGLSGRMVDWILDRLGLVSRLLRLVCWGLHRWLLGLVRWWLHRWLHGRLRRWLSWRCPVSCGLWFDIYIHITEVS